MGGKRLYTVSALLGLGTLASCAANDEPVSKGPKAITGDWGDETKYPELGGAYSNLTAAGATCVFNAKAGSVTITLDGTAQTVVVAKRAVDSLLVINGDASLCTDSVSSAVTTVSTKNIKTVAISDAGSNAQNLVLDFLAGTFGAGAKAKAGITVDLGGGTDTLAVRGTSGKDAFAAGDTGVAASSKGFAINSDAYNDIDLIGVENLTVSLAAGDDTFSGGGGSGTGDPYPSALTVYGGADKDTLTGGDGADSVYGGDGDDTITGGAGADKLNGDADNDTVTQGADPDGADTIVCGAGATDKVSYALRGSLANGTTEKVTVTVGTPYYDDDNDANTPDVPQQPNDGDSATSENDDVDTTCEVLVGGMGDDTLSGDGNANVIYGGPGGDTLSGAGGADTLYGEAGNDTFDETLYADEDADGLPYEVAASQATTGSDTFVGGDGTDLVDYSARTGAITAIMEGDIKTIATVSAGSAPKNDGESGENDNIVSDVENIYGGEGNDTLTGNALANTLRGGPGNDTLSGLAGDDIFDEKNGWDTSSPPAVVDNTLTSGNDKLIGGDGTDTADYSSRTVDLYIDMLGTATTADADDGADTDANGTPDEADDVYTDVENLKGGTGADTLTGNDGDNDIQGNAGDDTIAGGLGNDYLYGGADDDAIDGGAGNDTIDGGADQSAKYLTCGAGDDIAFNGTVDPAASPADLSCEILL